jgi:hypothetical protein
MKLMDAEQALDDMEKRLSESQCGSEVTPGLLPTSTSGSVTLKNGSAGWNDSA